MQQFDRQVAELRQSLREGDVSVTQWQRDRCYEAIAFASEFEGNRLPV